MRGGSRANMTLEQGDTKKFHKASAQCSTLVTMLSFAEHYETDVLLASALYLQSLLSLSITWHVALLIAPTGWESVIDRPCALHAAPFCRMIIRPMQICCSLCSTGRFGWCLYLASAQCAGSIKTTQPTARGAPLAHRCAQLHTQGGAFAYVWYDGWPMGALFLCPAGGGLAPFRVPR